MASRKRGASKKKTRIELPEGAAVEDIQELQLSNTSDTSLPLVQESSVHGRGHGHGRVQPGTSLPVIQESSVHGHGCSDDRVQPDTSLPFIQEPSVYGHGHGRIQPDSVPANESDLPRVRKPSKRAQQIDPLLTITPAKSSTKVRRPVVSVTPFAAQQVQSTQNQRAAAVLFTPRAVPRPPLDPSAPRPPLGPSQLRPVSPSPTPHYSTSLLASDGSSDSDSMEKELRAGIKKIDLTAMAHPDSGPKSPRAGPHSKERVKSLKPQGGAKDIWTFFEKSNACQSCILCKQIHSTDSSHKISTFGSKTSTTTLRKHLYTDHVEQWSLSCKEMKIPITAKDALEAIRQFDNQPPLASSNLNERPEYSKEGFIEAIVEFIVGDDQSINIVESPHLCKIFLMLRKELKESDIPGRTTIRNRIEKIYAQHLEELTEEMKKAVGKISFTTDAWTDPNQTPFMAVTAHWIQVVAEEGSMKKLQLRTDLIGFHKLPGRHTGEHLAQCFLFITDRLGITSKIGWITCDNATNNNTMMESLESFLRKRKISFDGAKARIRCFPHIVNLACKAALAAITDLFYIDDTVEHYQDYEPSVHRKDCIATIRSLVNAIRNSNLKKGRFSEYVQREFDQNYQLLRDVATRWSSTLLMINRVLKLKNAIDDITHDHEFKDLYKFQLSDQDWKLLADYQEILQIPHAFQDILGAETTPTLCYSIPAFAAFIKLWKDLAEQKPEWEDIIQPGLDKLEDYQDRLTDVHIIAMGIDPGNRLSFLRDQSDEEFERGKRIFLNAIRSYAKAPSAAPAIRAQAGRAKQVSAQSADILGLKKTRAVTPTVSVEQEVDKYLSNTNSGTSIVDFWQEHQEQYPHIFCLAMDIIPIQASSVPCERVFSSGKQTMAPRRNRISAQLMESLQLMKFSIRKGRPLKFTEGLSWSEELKEFEHAARTALIGDPEGYRRGLDDGEENSDEMEEELTDLQKDIQAVENAIFEGDEEDSEDDENMF